MISSYTQGTTPLLPFGFPGGIGRAIGDDNFDSLYRDVVSKVFDRLPDETWIYPGHGWDTTLGAERPHLDEWWERRW